MSSQTQTYETAEQFAEACRLEAIALGQNPQPPSAEVLAQLDKTEAAL